MDAGGGFPIDGGGDTLGRNEVAVVAEFLKAKGTGFLAGVYGNTAVHTFGDALIDGHRLFWHQTGIFSSRHGLVNHLRRNVFIPAIHK